MFVKIPAGFLYFFTFLLIWTLYEIVHNTEAKYKKQTNVRNIVISLRVLTSFEFMIHPPIQLSPFAKVP